MSLLYHAYVYLEFLILACTIYILAPENVICDHPQFEYQCIGRELSGWKPLQIHVSFYLTMKLLTLSMGMIQTDDFLIRVTKVCPPGFNFNIRNKIELTIFINGSFRNIVNGTEVLINDLGVYKAQVEVNGIPKSGNGGYSTFFPKEMSPQDVIDSINEAYNNKVFVV